jgi:hypothetical protein
VNFYTVLCQSAANLPEDGLENAAETACFAVPSAIE